MSFLTNIKSRNAVNALSLLLVMILLAGCATSQEKLLPVEEGRTMMDVWQSGSAGSLQPTASDTGHMTNRGLLDARQSLRRDIESLSIDYSDYTRDVTNEINSQFVRLPNPDLVMYVFPHLTGSPSAEQVPIPGYSTVFPLYSAPQYAMPGETKRPRQILKN